MGEPKKERAVVRKREEGNPYLETGDGQARARAQPTPDLV